MLLSAATMVVVLLALGRQHGDSVNQNAALDQRSSAPAAEAAVSTTVPQPIGPFLVVGADIVDPDGNLFTPVGANVAISVTDYPYVFEGGNGAVNDRLDAVREWGWNTVRATLRCTDGDGPSPQEVIDGIADTIDRFTAAEIVVVLTCHDATGQNPTVGSDLELAMRGFWDQAVERYGDNPYVWFNFFNEPYDNLDLVAWSALQTFYLERYRDAGTENVILVDLPGYGQAIDQATADEVTATVDGVCNVVIDFHAWGSVAGAQADIDTYRNALSATRDAGLAVVIGEAGVPQPLSSGTAGNPEWNESGFLNALEVATDDDFGMLWWHATGDTSDELFYSLTADNSGFWTGADGTNLSPAGARFWEFSRMPRPARPFTGDPADSGCEILSADDR